MQSISHVALVVEDLESAMADLSASMGFTFASVQERDLTLRFNGEVIDTPLRFSYSVDGPPHLEVVGVQPGTPWGTPSTMHHIGFWSDDLERDTVMLVDHGMPLEATYETGDGTPNGFAYCMSPHGLRVECVDSSREAAFDAWLSGGSFPASDAT